MDKNTLIIESCEPFAFAYHHLYLKFLYETAEPLRVKIDLLYDAEVFTGDGKSFENL